MFIYQLCFLVSYNRYYGGEKMQGYGCCGERSFFTKEEKIDMLKDYKESLEKEAKGVAEKIKQLEKE